MARRKPRSPRSTAASSPSQPADSRPAPAPDPPGQGINRRRPALLLAAVTAMAAWIAFLAWTALSGG